MSGTLPSIAPDIHHEIRIHCHFPGSNISFNFAIYSVVLHINNVLKLHSLTRFHAHSANATARPFDRRNDLLK